jgi:hypothetical protein
MFQSEDFNQLPKSVLARIPKLEGQTVKFRVMGAYKDPHNGGVVRVPYIKTVPSTDLITGDNNEVYQIAHIARRGGAPEMILFESSSAGHIIIAPDENGRYRPSDIIMYEYLSLCNYNISNPNRDITKEGIFEEVNDAKTAEKKVESKLTSIDLMRRVAVLSDDQVRLVAAKLGASEPTDSVQSLRLKLMDAAEADHDQLVSVINQTEADGEQLIAVQKAMDMKVIHLDRRNFMWKWTATKMDIREGDRKKTEADNVISLARWLRDTQDGAQVYATIKTAIKE